MAITQIPAQETKPSTGRYSIGETLYGVAFTYEGKNFASISPPMIWDDQMPKAFHFIQLEVTEHHKVLWDYDEPTAEKKYDGYKLKSSTGLPFTNQFPRASYGQTTDTADRVFCQDVPTDQIKAALDNEVNQPIEFILVTDIFSNLERGVNSDKLLEARRTQLKGLRDRLLQEFEAKFPGKTLSTEPIWKEHPDITRGIVIDKKA